MLLSGVDPTPWWCFFIRLSASNIATVFRFFFVSLQRQRPNVSGSFYRTKNNSVELTGA